MQTQPRVKSNSKPEDSFEGFEREAGLPVPKPTAVLVVSSTPAQVLNRAAMTESVVAHDAKVVFTAPNPNTRRDKSTKEVVKNNLDFKLGRKVKVIKVVDRRGNVECILKGRIKDMTTVGAYVSDFEKPNARPEWFPFKSKMQWMVLG